MAVSPPRSSGSSPGLLGEFPFSLVSGCFLMRFEALCRFLRLFQTSLTVPDTGNASALSPGSFSSTWALWTMFWWSHSYATPLDSTPCPWCPPGPMARRSAFISMTRSFPLVLGRIPPYLAPSATFWLPSSSGSSQGLLGEFPFSFLLERSRSHSDIFRRFFGLFLVSSAPIDAPDTCVSSLVGPTSKLD